LAILSLAAVSSALAQDGALPTSDVLGRTPTWRPSVAADVKAQALDWLNKTKPDAAVRAKAVAIWAHLPEQPSGAELLDRLAATIALGDPRAAKLLELLSKPHGPLALPSETWLADPKLPLLLSANLRLLYGRWLVHASLLDEAMEQLAGLNTSDVVAPAELLFYQGVVYHRLLKQEEGMKAIDDLLAGEDASPRRYVAVARLMQADLHDLKPDTLDHISRRMEDIQRRLDLGRAGPKVRNTEDGVIKSLDKIIKKLEDAQQQGGGGNSNNLQPGKPLDQSRPHSSPSRGEVTKKDIGSKDGWGDLPPKEREEAIQQIGRDFPSHYRDVIEQYFRRLAAEEDSKKD
jgi:hypothetical protein